MSPPAHDRPAPDERRILEERARALAEPRGRFTDDVPRIDLLTFSCGGSAYAIAASDAVAVVRLGDTTPVPGTPPAIRGVVNHRGRVLPVLDVGRIFAPGAADTQAEYGIVVAAGDASFVVGAETAPSLASFDAAGVTPAGQLGDRPDGVVRAVTSDAVGILDIGALARDPRVAVDDRIE